MKFKGNKVEKKKNELIKSIIGKRSKGKSKAIALLSLLDDEVPEDIAKKILVNVSWNNKDGFKSTKSGDDRILEIAPPLVKIFEKLKKDYPESSFVFPRIDKWDRGDQARELRMFLEGLGLPRIRFYDLRASWATIVLSKGIPPIKVMMMGGWKDLKTMQYYVRKARVNIKGITDKLNLE